LHNGVKEAYQNSNKVDHVAQMYNWDNWRLLVEVRKALLQHLANDKIGNWSEKIHNQYAKPTILQFISYVLGGLRNQNIQRLLRLVK
jgi:hypothetical protein